MTIIIKTVFIRKCHNSDIPAKQSLWKRMYSTRKNIRLAFPKSALHDGNNGSSVNLMDAFKSKEQ